MKEGYTVKSKVKEECVNYLKFHSLTHKRDIIWENIVKFFSVILLFIYYYGINKFGFLIATLEEMNADNKVRNIFDASFLYPIFSVVIQKVFKMYGKPFAFEERYQKRLIEFFLLDKVMELFADLGK